MIGGLFASLVGLAWARTAFKILLFLLALLRSGERAGRLEAAARRPRDRGELVERLRDGGF